MASRNSALIAGVVAAIIATVVFSQILETPGVGIAFGLAIGIVAYIAMNDGTWGKDRG